MREKKGISARELSVRSGMSTSYVSKLEAGKIDPTTKAFAHIAQVLRLSAMEVGVAVYAAIAEDQEG